MRQRGGGFIHALQRPQLPPAAAFVMRGVEFAAAGRVLLFGAGLLLGYTATERVTCFQNGNSNAKSEVKA
jgi:hypothetical protein